MSDRDTLQLVRVQRGRVASHSGKDILQRGTRFTISTTFMAIPSSLPKRSSAWESHSHGLPSLGFAHYQHHQQGQQDSGSPGGRTGRWAPWPSLEQAYKALVRPTLEFASPVWDPYTVRNINKLEAFQRRVDRWVVNRHRQTFGVNAM